MPEKVYKMMPKRKVVLLLVAALLIVFTSSIASLDAKSKKKKYTLKTGDEQKALMLSHVQKKFVITPETPIANIEKIGKINNAIFVVDSGNKFPPKSLLEKLSIIGKPVNLILPTTFGKGHLRRLKALQNYEVTFKINKKNFNKEAVLRMMSIGLHHKYIELNLHDLTGNMVKLFSTIRQYTLRLIINEGEVLSKKQINLLRRKTFAGIKEIVLPYNYPVKAISKLKRIKQIRIILQARGTGPNPKHVKMVNKFKKTDSGAILRGLIKLDEAFNYIMLNNLASLTMYVEDWNITDHFVRIMNSNGEVTAKN